MNKRVETLYKRYGRDYFSKIGKLGAIALWKKYRRIPIGTSYYILVKRSELK